MASGHPRGGVPGSPPLGSPPPVPARSAPLSPRWFPCRCTAVPPPHTPPPPPPSPRDRPRGGAEALCGREMSAAAPIRRWRSRGRSQRMRCAGRGGGSPPPAPRPGGSVGCGGGLLQGAVIFGKGSGHGEGCSAERGWRVMVLIPASRGAPSNFHAGRAGIQSQSQTEGGRREPHTLSGDTQGYSTHGLLETGRSALAHQKIIPCPGALLWIT